MPWTMDTRIPECIRPVLNDYLLLLRTELPGLIGGCYIHGSIALNAFNPYLSDIDFITILTRRAKTSEVKNLKAIHQKLKLSYPQWKLEGSYLQWEDVGRSQQEIAPYPYYHDSALYSAGYHDINLVTWWLLKHRGICLIGLPPENLAFTVDWNLLQTKMKENLNSYWVSWTRSPRKVAYLLTDSGIQWAVLGVLRLFYALREDEILSKTQAGRYGLVHLPPRWHQLIQEAINLREIRHGSSYRSKVSRAVEAVSFLRYLINVCNEQGSSRENS
ncbi:aminoglycoside adenylyltransferase domain-containing protein [Nostoc sp.]|uniref:aminoglycoside adenylyltransferase domain-containing protein n=1 Tax=Nostoc sp. TaxID=1180 RepID=UPI002FF56970